MKLVRLKKIKALEDPAVPTSENRSLQADELAASGESPWVDYEIEGLLSKRVQTGERLTILRLCRNDIHVVGVFSTSLVQSIVRAEDHQLIFTKNSIYKLENL